MTKTARVFLFGKKGTFCGRALKEAKSYFQKLSPLLGQYVVTKKNITTPTPNLMKGLWRGTINRGLLRRI